jgi:hypothetical protein
VRDVGVSEVLSVGRRNGDGAGRIGICQVSWWETPSAGFAGEEQCYGLSVGGRRHENVREPQQNGSRVEPQERRVSRFIRTETAPPCPSSLLVH